MSKFIAFGISFALGLVAATTIPAGSPHPVQQAPSQSYKMVSIDHQPVVIVVDEVQGS